MVVGARAQRLGPSCVLSLLSLVCVQSCGLAAAQGWVTGKLLTRGHCLLCFWLGQRRSRGVCGAHH